MTTGGAVGRKAHFQGLQKLATVDDLDAFVRRARPGESFVYCEAPDLIRGETSLRVAALTGDGLVRPHHVRRQGGGWEWFVVRTGKGLPKKKSAAEQALSDPFTETIYRAIKRAANFGDPCPSLAQMARIAGLDTRPQAAWRFRKLINAGLIESEIVYDKGVPGRIVTVVESGRKTARACPDRSEGADE